MLSPGRVAAAALALVPGALTVYLAFNGGGYFADTTAVAAVGLALVLLLRVTLAERPFEGLAPAVCVAAVALALLAVWTLASAWWSDSAARAVLEFDRVLLYVLVVVLCASMPREAWRLRLALGGVAVGIVAVCLIGLVTRVAPDVWPIGPNVEQDRLSYPITYWNALGLLSVVGIVLCLHFASSLREHRIVRVLGAAALPALAVTLLFTFSRGAIAVCAVGIVVYAAAARPRGLVSALVAAGPLVAVAVADAYGADLVASVDFASPRAVDQGHEVAAMVALCTVGAGALRTLLLLLDDRLEALPPLSESGRSTRLAAAGAAVGAAVVAVAILLALDAPGYVDRQYDRFVRGSPVVGERGDVRTRLSDPANNGRLDQWKVALEGYHDSPLRGRGAGTYQLAWAEDRPIAFEVNDAHSLYAEVLGELGLVGLALVLLALVALAAGTAAGLRGDEPEASAAALAVLVTWALRAGIDWDWEMPVVTLPALALAAAAAAAAPGRGMLGFDLGRVPRVAIGLGVAALAVTPFLMWVSQARLDRSVEAFERGDCVEAIDEALGASSALGPRPEPWEVIGYCDVRLGRPRLGVRAFENAVDRDPDSWEAHYGLALSRASAGLDPRPSVRRTSALNPRDRLTRDLVRRFRSGGPKTWRRRAARAPLPLGR